MYFFSFYPFLYPTGHRSPPPHLRRREYDYVAEGESFPVPTPTIASIPAFTASFVATTQSAPVHKQRERPTRFDRPAAPVPVLAPAPIPTTNHDANDNESFSHLQQSRSSRNHDVYVPGDISIIPLRRGERDRDELTSSAQVGGGDANPLLINKRMRLPSDERGEHTPLPPSERRARGPGADSSAQDTSPPSSEPQSQERGPGQSRTYYTTFRPLLLHADVSPSLLFTLSRSYAAMPLWVIIVLS